jgi:glycosidase
MNNTIITTPRSGALAHHASWLSDAVFYEIYPQSFADSNNDGIGDIPGIISKLDYIKQLGCTALWINPCFQSPFRDAGYDVSNYTKVAPRYGTNDDLIRLFHVAHEKGIHVLLDLVPGHTSFEHPWFQASSQENPADRGAYSDRYIWTDSAFEQGDGMPFISGMTDRDGAFIVNFFASQPALNYGYLTRRRPWQQSIDSPAAASTRKAMQDVIRFWLSRGCDGFRVDMADSLVKNDDDDKSATIETWRRILTPIKTEFPQAAFVSEWSKPWQSLNAGFDMDFYLDWSGERPNGYNMLARYTPDNLGHTDDRSYFAAASGSDPMGFLNDYLPLYKRTHQLGSWCFITCNHDTPRLAPRLTTREITIADTLFLTMPGVPYIYYGDEIGMRYRKLPTVEGGYARTGSRTPMQWDSAKPNAGFSTADPDKLYLPVDPAPDAPSVAAQEKDPHSLLSFIRSLIALRHAHPALKSDAAFSVLFARSGSRPLVYARQAHDGKRDEKIVIALNPGLSTEHIALPASESAAQTLLTVGSASAAVDSEAQLLELLLEPQSAVIALIK